MSLHSGVVNPLDDAIAAGQAVALENGEVRVSMDAWVRVAASDADFEVVKTTESSVIIRHGGRKFEAQDRAQQPVAMVQID